MPKHLLPNSQTPMCEVSGPLQSYIKLKVHILNEVIVYKVHPLVQNCGIKYKLHSFLPDALTHKWKHVCNHAGLYL